MKGNESFPIILGSFINQEIELTLKENPSAPEICLAIPSGGDRRPEKLKINDGARPVA